MDVKKLLTMKVDMKMPLSLKKRTPEILAVAGVVSIGAGTFTACKGTIQAMRVLEAHADIVEDIKADCEAGDLTKEEEKQEITKEYMALSLTLAKIYAPAAVLTVTGIGMMLTSNNILRKRNAALATAYAAVDKAYKTYRKGVIDRFGEDVDYKIRHEIKEEEVETTEVNDKGKEKKVKKKIDVASPTEDMYVRYFTKSNVEWKGSDDLNEFLFRGVEHMANDRLIAKGHLTLNEVYRALGFEETKAGMVVGWIYDKKNPNGDNFVQIERHKVYLPNEFGDYEEVWALDFNVDGNIYAEMA